MSRAGRWVGAAVAFAASFVAALAVAPPEAGAFVVVRRAPVVRTSVVYRPHPVAAGVAIGAAAAATAIAVGTIVHTLPPSCHSTMVGNVAYQQCGSTWYQPHYAGSQVTYVVVNPPR